MSIQERNVFPYKTNDDEEEEEEEEEAPIIIKTIKKRNQSLPRHRAFPKRVKRKKNAWSSCIHWICCCCLGESRCCCCCGPCLGGCVRWLFLCGSLCFAALLVGTVYIRSHRTCCGESADMCLAYASLKLPTEYDSMMEFYRDSTSSSHVSKHTLRRSFDHCLSYEEISTRAGRNTMDCYHELLHCMTQFVLVRNHTFPME